MVMVAQNKYQCSISCNSTNSPWGGIIAGILIIRASGGTVIDFSSKDATVCSANLICTSAGGGGRNLSSEILELVASHDCVKLPTCSAIWPRKGRNRLRLGMRRKRAKMTSGRHKPHSVGKK